ncbi:hypothetical protein AB0M68_20670 [Streptomyces sp. NPDC051453]|uniref:hypothetical protein n=1 Tax=Streptomyces sp. NPDC051453 TaxID=3154941 RepID=UPI0034143E31
MTPSAPWSSYTLKRGSRLRLRAAPRPRRHPGPAPRSRRPATPHTAEKSLEVCCGDLRTKRHFQDFELLQNHENKVRFRDV